MDQIGGVPATHFRLSVTAALRDQLNAALDGVQPAPLRQEAVSALQKRGGVYQLFYDGELVYIGKSNNDLPGRLSQHATKLSGRVGPPIERVTFRCAYVDEDLHAVSAEKLLIDQYRAKGAAAWNVNGFGNKDPGKQRDTSLVKEGHFDRLFPIDLDIEVALPGSETLQNVAALMLHLKAALPYTFRFTSKGPKWTALKDIDVPPDEVSLTRTTRQWMEWLAERLPATWCIVALPGYLIGYPDLNYEAIESRTGAWYREQSGVVVFEPHEAKFGSGEVPEELNSSGDD